MRVFWICAALAASAFLAWLSVFTVGPSEYVYVTEFGRHVATYDGSDTVNDAGLHVRWPWPIQSIQRLDRRLQQFDLPGTEFLTHDPEGKTIDKTLTVEAYACWRIPSKEAVDLFLRRVGTPERARTILAQRITSQLGAAIGRMTLDDLISTEPGRVEERLARLWQTLTEPLRPELEREYGIELVDVRLRRFNHPAEVRESIFERIRSERAKKAEFYRTEGIRQASKIRTEAKVKALEMKAEARAAADVIRGEADNAAAAIRNQAQIADPEFYAFLKKLDQLTTLLGDARTVLLLSTQRKLFELLEQPPALSPGNGNQPAIKPGPTPKGPALPGGKGGN